MCKLYVSCPTRALIPAETLKNQMDRNNSSCGCQPVCLLNHLKLTQWGMNIVTMRVGIEAVQEPHSMDSLLNKTNLVLLLLNAPTASSED